MFSGMRPLPVQGRHCCILSLILRPPPPTLSTKPRPPHSWHGTSTETVSSTEGRVLPVIPACSAGMTSPLAGPRPRRPSVHQSVTAAVARLCPWLRPRYRKRRSRRWSSSVAQPACPGPSWPSVRACRSRRSWRLSASAACRTWPPPVVWLERSTSTSTSCFPTWRTTMTDDRPVTSEQAILVTPEQAILAVKPAGLDPSKPLKEQLRGRREPQPRAADSGSGKQVKTLSETSTHQAPPGNSAGRLRCCPAAALILQQELAPVSPYSRRPTASRAWSPVR
jgi:hypothetical protein